MPDDDMKTLVVVKPREAKAKPKREYKPNPDKQPPFNVVLLDDNDHTYEYVIRMLGKLFGYGLPKAFMLAFEVDATGRVILLTTTKEHAELKRDQIHGFGKDMLLSRSKGSMSAIIEPAED